MASLPLLTLFVLAAVIFFPMCQSWAFDYEPMPVVKMTTLPTEQEFLNKPEKELLKDVWYSTTIRQNGESINSYLLYSGQDGGKFLAIFYIEDKTEDNFSEYIYYKFDYFFFDIIKKSEKDNNEVGIISRFERDCVKIVTDDVSRYSNTGDCSRGKGLVKQTENGWAIYLKFFSNYPIPTQDEPYQIKWAYIDARKHDEKNQDKSLVYVWPNNFDGYGTASLSDQKIEKELFVNSGKITVNDFLYTPNNILTKDLEVNSFVCADNTVTVTPDQERYEKTDVANIKAKIKSTKSTSSQVTLKIFDENNNLVYSTPAAISSIGEVSFLIDLDKFENGIYTAEVRLGVYGSKSQAKFAIGVEKFTQIEQNTCNVYLVYDNTSKELYVFAILKDSSGFYKDSFKVFVDRAGDGSQSLLDDDLYYYVDKEYFGGYKFTPGKGWLKNKQPENGNARINKIHEGYEVLIKIPSVSKNFRIAFEQSDNTVTDFKKKQVPQGSFSTIPASWAVSKSTGKSIPKLTDSAFVPQEIILTQNIDINLILVGQAWTDSLKNKVLSQLTKSYEPIIYSELHLAGTKFNYNYNFVTVSDDASKGLFEFMKKNSQQVAPFYGEEEFDEPWGIASWIKNNHTEWVNKSQQRFEISYKLVDAKAVEDYINKNIISANSNLNRQNAANIVFVAADPANLGFIHDYSLTTTDPSTQKPHRAVGMMGYGGRYNFYFFDLYAVPWDSFQGFKNNYDLTLVNQYTNFHDLKTEDQRARLLWSYVNNATSLVITPSYSYPSTYKDKYLLDLVIVTDKKSTAINTLITHFINEEKIKRELESLIPYSEWEIKVTLEKKDSRSLPSELGKVISTTKNIPLFAQEGSPTIQIVDSKEIAKQLVNWASTRESTGFRDFRDIKESKFVVPVLVIINERDKPVYLDRYGGLGLAAWHPDDETQPCCALGVSYDNAVWDEKVGVTDLVLHEVGHILGLLHPFDGYRSDRYFFQNYYFNWYDSVMSYNFPPNGCGAWYSYHVGKSCGIADGHFTKYEKDNIAKGTTAYLIKAAKNNMYMAMLDLNKDGDAESRLPVLKDKLAGINKNIQKATTLFEQNNLDSTSGALKYALAAAVESERLISDQKIEYKEIPIQEAEIKIPSWIKQQAKWWAADSISNDEFLNAIQFLIKERIIVLPQPDAPSSESTLRQIPSWLKKNAELWANDVITDKELVAAFQFLIKNGLIRV